MKEKNPFIVQGYVEPDYFCDREVETKRLMSDIANGRHVTLLAPRRYGKSGLIRHALALHRDEYAFIYVDLLSTTNQADFVKAFANAVVGTLDTRMEKAAATFASFFRSVRPTLKADSNGEMSFSFDMAATESSTTLSQVFDYLAGKTDREIVIALDEFQQVATYPEKGTEALLRSRIQFLPSNIHFVFAGSQMHLLGEMFSSPKRPFYQSTSFLSIDVIPIDRYRAFAELFFRAEGRAFDPACFDLVYRRFDGITWYVQAVMNEIWSTGDGFTAPEQVDVAVRNLVERRSLIFHDLDVSQSDSARMLLRAVASAGRVTSPTSSAFLRASGLLAPSTAAGALKQLMDKEILYRTESGYVVYDRLFGEYLKGCASE